jgi:hypothetical protein
MKWLKVGISSRIFKDIPFAAHTSHILVLIISTVHAAQLERGKAGHSGASNLRPLKLFDRRGS